MKAIGSTRVFSMPTGLRAEGLRRACRVFAVASIAMATAHWAMAGAGVVTTTVTPISDRVTYTTPATTSPARPALTTYIGYRVSISNAGGNTINNISFTGATAVTDAQEQAVFDSAEGATCTASAGGTSVTCTIGQLKAGQPFPTFAVFFRAPAKDTTTPTPDGAPGQCATTDCVAFSGTTFYAETTGGVPQSTPTNSTVPWSTDAVLLGTNNPTRIKSAVTKAGGTFFTGSGAIPTPAAPFTTQVQVPAAPIFTTLEIVQSTPLATTCSTNVFVDQLCEESDITVPGTFSPYLTIVLRQDASSIATSTKIGSILIQYSNPEAIPAVVNYVVGLCASPTTPRTDGLPCIADRKEYKKNSLPADLAGDFEWTLINRGNGSYRVR